MRKDNLIVICSWSVDKHRVPVPIWKRRSCRVPLCCLEVQTVKENKWFSKHQIPKYQSISKHHIYNRPNFHNIALWLRNIVQRICPHRWVGHERTKANGQSKGESQTEIINTSNVLYLLLGASRYWKPDVNFCFWRTESAFHWRSLARDLIGIFPINLVNWLDMLALDTSCRSLFT